MDPMGEDIVRFSSLVWMAFSSSGYVFRATRLYCVGQHIFWFLISLESYRLVVYKLLRFVSLYTYHAAQNTSWSRHQIIVTLPISYLNKSS